MPVAATGPSPGHRPTGGQGKPGAAGNAHRARPGAGGAAAGRQGGPARGQQGAGPDTGTGRASAAPWDPTTENYYQLLGVPFAATPDQITRAYRTAMKRAHPDRQPDAARRLAAEEQAKLLNAAYATLSRPARRQAYDRSIRAQAVQDQIMGRYVSGMGGASGTADPFTVRRREPTAAERRERRRSDRNALVSLVVVFGGITAFFVVALLLYSLVRFLIDAAF